MILSPVGIIVIILFVVLFILLSILFKNKNKNNKYYSPINNLIIGGDNSIKKCLIFSDK